MFRNGVFLILRICYFSFVVCIIWVLIIISNIKMILLIFIVIINIVVFYCFCFLGRGDIVFCEYKLIKKLVRVIVSLLV